MANACHKIAILHGICLAYVFGFQLPGNLSMAYKLNNGAYRSGFEIKATNVATGVMNLQSTILIK